MKEFVEEQNFKNKIPKEDQSFAEIIKKTKDLAGEVKGGTNCPFSKLEKSAERLLRVMGELDRSIK